MQSATVAVRFAFVWDGGSGISDVRVCSSSPAEKVV